MSDTVAPKHVDPMSAVETTPSPAPSSIAAPLSQEPRDAIDDTHQEQPQQGSNLHPVRRSEVVAECIRQGYYRTPNCNDKLHLHFKGYNCFEDGALDDYTDCKVLWLEGNCFTDDSFRASVVCTSESVPASPSSGLDAAGYARRQRLLAAANGGHLPPPPKFEENPRGTITGGPNLLVSQVPILRSLYLHQNLLTTFPTVAAACQRLDSVNLSDNFIASLSDGGLVTPIWMWPADVLDTLDDLISDLGGKKKQPFQQGGSTDDAASAPLLPIDPAAVGCCLSGATLWSLLLDGTVESARALAVASRQLAEQSVLEHRVRVAERRLDDAQRMARLVEYGKQLSSKPKMEDANEEGDANDEAEKSKEPEGDSALAAETCESVKAAAGVLASAQAACEEAIAALSPAARSIYSHHGAFGWVSLSVGLWDMAVKRLIMTEGRILVAPSSINPATGTSAVPTADDVPKALSPSKSRLLEEKEKEAAEGGNLMTSDVSAALADGPPVENYGVSDRQVYLARFRRACEFAVRLRQASFAFCVSALPGGGSVKPVASPTSPILADDVNAAQLDANISTAVVAPEAPVNTLTWIQLKNNHLRNPVELLPLLLCCRLSALDLSGNRIEDGDALMIFLESVVSLGVGEFGNNNSETPTTSLLSPASSTANPDDNDDEQPTAAARSGGDAEPADLQLPADAPYYHLKSLMMGGNPAIRKITQYRKRVLSTVIGAPPRGASMLGPEGNKPVPRGLSYLDDRPVFENERRLVVAWAAGGLDGEKRERETIKKEEEDAVHQRLRDFKTLMRRAAAAAGIRSNSATGSASSSLGGMITIEDTCEGSDDDRTTSSETDDGSDDHAAPVVQLSSAGADNTNKAPSPPPSSITAETAAATIPRAVSLERQAAQRAQEAADRHGIVIIEDVDDDDDDAVAP